MICGVFRITNMMFSNPGFQIIPADCGECIDSSADLEVNCVGLSDRGTVFISPFSTISTGFGCMSGLQEMNTRRSGGSHA